VLPKITYNSEEGVAQFVSQRPATSELPIITSFDEGRGEKLFLNGKVTENSVKFLIFKVA
jgi:endo-beta-N-acetylglucosaminidase D